MRMCVAYLFLSFLFHFMAFFLSFYHFSSFTEHLFFYWTPKYTLSQYTYINHKSIFALWDKFLFHLYDYLFIYLIRDDTFKFEIPLTLKRKIPLNQKVMKVYYMVGYVTKENKIAIMSIFFTSCKGIFSLRNLRDCSLDALLKTVHIVTLGQ